MAKTQGCFAILKAEKTNNVKNIKEQSNEMQ